MKVLHVIPSIGPLRGGPSVALRMFTQSLAGAGLTVDVATTDDNGPGKLDVPLSQPVLEDNVRFWYFSRQIRFYTVSGPLTAWLGRHVYDYDLLHIHALFSYATMPAAFFAKRYRVPYIIRPLGTLQHWGMTNRRPFLKNLSFRLIESRVLNNANLIHYTSAQEKTEAEEQGINRPSVILPLGVDISPFDHMPARDSFSKRFPQAAGRVVLLFLSRIDAKKGLDLLLPAFAKVHQQNPQTVLVLAGTGEDQFIQQLKDQASPLDIEDSVIWAGFLSGDDKLAAFAGADLFVLPSYSENFGIATVEAMAARLPVVITNAAGIAYEVEHANAGLVVTTDSDTLAASLQKLVDNEDLRQSMGANGRQLAEQRFSLPVMTRNLVETYERIVKEKR